MNLKNYNIKYFQKILFKFIKVILQLLLVLSTFQKIYLVLLIIFIFLLLIIKLYIRLYNKFAYVKIRIMSYILQITNVKKTNLNFVTKTITSLIIYLKFFFSYFFAIKNGKYIAKIIIDLLITCKLIIF